MHFRIARHTNNLEKLRLFYTSILNLSVLGSFKDHDNYDGIFIGKKNLNWHIEFTTSNKPAEHKFDDDDILIFYPESMHSYDKIIKNINKSNIKIKKAINPYWNENGILIQDPDGYNIIISNLKANDGLKP